MKKTRNFQRFFASLLLLTVSTLSWAYDFEVDGIYYKKSGSNAIVTYKTTSDNYNYSAPVIIPSTVTYYSNTYNVTSIGQQAFQSCSGLPSVTIPNSVTSIDGYAFDGCSGLTSITIPNSVTTIWGGAFRDCTHLTRAEFASIESLCNISFKNEYANPLHRAHHLYIGGQEVKDLVIPNSVTSIGNYTFQGCSTLTSITIPNNVTSIGDYAFWNCSGLTSVTIGNNVTSIGEWAFRGCSSLTCVTNLSETPQSTGDGDFSNRANATLYVPKGCKAAYAAANKWKDFKEIKELSPIISFADANVKTICVANWDTNDDGELDEDEAAAVTELGEVFNNNNITSFDELQYFTGLTTIGNDSFYGCTGLTSISIPESVTSIGECAFGWCSCLTSITIPNGVTSIGNQAFYGCTDLTSITIPESVTSIGQNAFTECTGLTSVTINSQIVDSWFSSLTSIQEVTLGDNVTSIGRGAFWGCSGLTSINIPENVTSIGGNAFYGCTSLTSITIPESVTSIGYYAFYNCTGLTSVTINSQTVDNWFSNLTSIQEVTLGDNVTSIGRGAFGNCTGLTSITIPESVTYIGDRAFLGCYFLKESFINLSTLTSRNNWDATLCDEITNEGLRIKDGIVVKYTGTSTTVTIPDYVKGIGNHAFFGCIGLTSITIPESVTSIGDGAFRNCTGLTSITIPNGVTSIENGAFYGCTSLTSITIPESVTSIGGNAFEECTSLASITIPENVTYIGDDAFMDCYFLTESFINLSTLTSSNNWGATLYDEITNDGLLIKDGIVVKYTGTSTSVTIPDYVKGIGNQAFSGCIGLTSITIPESVTSIGDYAFYNCIGLTSITIPESVTSIGDRAFSACYGLTSINIPESVTSIGEGTFDNCTSLTSITIPESVTSIGNGAFSYCSGLTSITIPESVTSIGGNAFWGCNRLKSVTMPANNISFTDSYAFGYDNNIESVYISDLTKWLQTNFGKGNNPLRSGAKLYLNNEEVKNLVIPEGTASINIAVFEGCESITSVSIPSSVTSIGSYAFADCPNLTSVKVGIKNPLAIDGYTFTNRTNATLYVPYGYVYDKADYWKEFKEIVEIMPGIASLSELSNNKLYMLTTEYYELQLSEGQGRLEWKDVALLSNPNHMGLVTDISQLSSPFTEPSEGSLEALLDNNTSTYWHSEWSGGEVPVHSHYLQVDLKESVDENIQLVFTRRIQANNDHITQWGVFGSNDPDASDDAWTELASLSTPFHNKYETILSDAFDTQGYRYLRFYIDNTTGQSLESGGFGHLSEFRLFKASYFDEKPDAYKQFAILNINGKYYLYSPAVSAFYIMDTEFCPNFGSAFTIQDDLTGNDYRWTLTTSVDGQSRTLGTHVKIAPMADFNPTEALATFMDTNASTDISQLDNAIYIEPFTAGIGSKVQMDICLKNAEAASAYVFDLVLPEGITVAKNSNDKYIDELSDRHEDHTRTFNYKGDKTYSLSTLSGNSEQLTGNDGPIRLETIAVSDNMAEGNFAIEIKNASYSKPDGTLVSLPDTRAVVTVVDYILGDVNGNGGVDIGDAVTIVNYLVGKESSIFVAKAADTNKNGQIDIGDAVTIVNKLVGKITNFTREFNIIWDEKEPE